MDEQEIKAWERQPDEPNRWFIRFQMFLRMGHARSLLGCVNLEREADGKKRTTNPPMSWRDARIQYNWDERAAAYDKHLSDMEFQKLEERRMLQINHELEDAELLRQKAQEILKTLPIIRKKKDDGAEVIIVEPASSSEYNSANKMLRTAADMARRALGMVQKQVDVTSGGEKFGNMSDEEVRQAILNGVRELGLDVVDVNK